MMVIRPVERSDVSALMTPDTDEYYNAAAL